MTIDYDRTVGCSIPHCLNMADGWLDGQALCIPHIELLLERQEAIALCPDLRSTLPPFEQVWLPF